MLFDTLALISLIIIIALLKKLVNIFPSLVASILRWKENVNIEMSTRLRLDRNILALAMVIPFCLVCYRFDLYTPGFLEGLGEEAKIGITIGVFTVFVIIRKCFSLLIRPTKVNPKTYSHAASSDYTFFIILTLLLLATGGILTFLDIDDATIKSAMIWISGIIYFIFIIRKTQIFASSCNLFRGFLYLCALEIVPTAGLIVSALNF